MAENQEAADIASAYVAGLDDTEFASFVAATREPSNPKGEPTYPAEWAPTVRPKGAR